MDKAGSASKGRQPRRKAVSTRHWSVSLLVAALSVPLLLPAAPTAGSEGSVQADEAEAEPYYTKPVQWMVDNNIVTDTTGPCFGPHTPTTRGETALYMWRMEDQPEAPLHPFDDVTDERQQPAVSWMYDTGITTGTSPTTFAPDEQLTRVQLAALLHRLAGEPTASGHPFVDVVRDWQQQPVAWMVANEITTGTGPTTFAPDEPLTRGQLATFLYRYNNSPEVTINADNPPCSASSDLDAGDQGSCALGNDENNETDDNENIVCGDDNEQPQADPQNCMPRGTSAMFTAGFPLPDHALTSVGTVRIAVLFVDFPNAKATHSTLTEAHKGLPYVEDYLETSSYHKVDFEFVPLHQWLRAEHDFEHYLEPTAIGGTAIGREINSEATRLADSHIDFTNFDAIMVVLPSSRFGDGIASGSAHTNEGTVSHTVRINSNPLDRPRAPHRWGPIGAHELSHNLGLLDMYPYDQDLRNRPDESTQSNLARTQIGLMGLGVYYPGASANWDADEMLAWSRWQLEWLDSTQVQCVTGNEATVTLGPVGDPGENAAMAAIPLSETEVIVIESRRRIGYDAPEVFSGRTGLANEGVLIYTVDASLESGQLPVRVANDTGSSNGNGIVDRNPILTTGESLTTRGYTITVQSSTDATHTVTIVKTTDPD